MNWRRYSDKIPIYVSAGVLITGSFWFLRERGDDHISGEDIVELRATVVERSAAFLTGPMTRSTTSEVQVVVTDDTSGGEIFWDGETHFEFNQYNWDEYRMDFFIRATSTAPAGSYAEFGFLIDGEFNSGRIRVAVGKDPPGGTVVASDIGDLYVARAAARLDPGTGIQIPVKMKAAPSRVVSGAPDRVDVGEQVVFDDFFAALTGLRSLAQASQTYASGGIWWLGSGTDDFDADFASAGGAGFLTVNRPSYMAYTNWSRASDEGPTGGLYYAEEGYPTNVSDAVLTPRLFSLNSVVVLSSSGIVCVPGAFGWSPVLPPLVAFGGPYTNLFAPLAWENVLPGPWDALGRTAGSSASVYSMSEFPFYRGSWWTGLLETNVLWAWPTYDYVSEAGGTNVARTTRFGDNLLNIREAADHAASVAGALNRTISVRPLQFIETNDVRFGGSPTRWETREWYAQDEQGGFTESGSSTNGGAGTPAFWSSSLPVRMIQADAESMSYSYVAKDGANETTRWEYTYGGWEEAGSVVNPARATAYSDSSSAEEYEVRSVMDAYVDYPSEFALTNRLVSRVRVYAAFDYKRNVRQRLERKTDWGSTSYSVTNSPPPTWPSGLPDAVTDSTLSTVPYNAGFMFTDVAPASELAGVLSGAEIVLSEFWDAPGAMSFGSGTRLVDMFHPSVSGNGHGAARALKSLRLTKLVDVANPTEYPIRVSLDFSGFTGFSGWDNETGMAVTHIWNGEYAEFFVSEYDYQYAYYTAPVADSISKNDERKSLSRDVKVYPSLVIVVDWNFKHLVSTPYEPDPHTPEWLSTNSP